MLLCYCTTVCNCTSTNICVYPYINIEIKRMPNSIYPAYQLILIQSKSLRNDLLEQPTRVEYYLYYGTSDEWRICVYYVCGPIFYITTAQTSALQYKAYCVGMFTASLLCCVVCGCVIQKILTYIYTYSELLARSVVNYKALGSCWSQSFRINCIEILDKYISWFSELISWDKHDWW